MKTILTLLFILAAILADWLTETRRMIAIADVNANLIASCETEEQGAISRLEAYLAGEIRKQIISTTHSDFIDITITQYQRDDLLIGEMIQGRSPIIYKHDRPEDGPFSSLLDSRSYFKSKTEGVNFSRSVNIQNGDNIEDVRYKLENLAFEKNILDATDYRASKERYERTMAELQ